MLKRIKNFIEDETGSALAAVIVATVVLSIFVAATISISYNENNQALYQTNETRAHYIAKAAAESVAKQMETLTEDELNYITSNSPVRVVVGSADTVTTSSEPILADIGTVNVTVSTDNGTDFIVSATGDVEGHNETVRLSLAYDPGGAITQNSIYAAYSIGPMTSVGGTVTEVDYDQAGLVDPDNYPYIGGSDGMNQGTIDGRLGSGDVVYFNNDRRLADVTEGVSVETPFEIDIYELVFPNSQIPADSEGIATVSKVLSATDTFKLDGGDIHRNTNTFNISTNNGDLMRDETTKDPEDSPPIYDSTFEMVAGSWGVTPPVADDFESHRWTLGYFYNDVDLGNVDIAVSGNDFYNVILVVEDTVSLQNCTLSIPENVFVKLYVLDDADTTEEVVVDLGNIEVVTAADGHDYEAHQLDIIVFGEDSINIDASSEITGMFYAPDGKIVASTGNSGVLNGSLYAGKVELQANININFPANAGDTNSGNLGYRDPSMDVNHYMHAGE